MSRGFGTMQRATLQALDRIPSLRVPWQTDGERAVPEGAAGHLVDVYAVRTLQVTTAWVRGEWCDGWRCVARRRGPLRVRDAPPKPFDRHAPHSAWRQREYVSFSRALHRLVTLQVLWPVLLTSRRWVEPTIALANPHWGIAYVVKC